MYDTKEIKDKFLKLQTREDVAELLGIGDKSLRYFLYAVKPDNMYSEFIIKKKNGDDRHISAPDKRLKNIQRKMAHILNCVYKVKPAVHGFAIEKNIVTNAENHVGKKYVFNIDLENFFDQIHFGRVRGMLMNPPYNIGAEAALVIAQLACCNGKLPQGAPTSPVLSNMVCSPLDTQLTKLAYKYKLQYTRYADDISFSSYKNEFPVGIAYTDEEGIHVGKELKEILINENFVVNTHKIRIFDYRKRQEVTGLVVNQFVNIRRGYIKKIRAILHHCKKDGVYEAAKDYIERGNCKNKSIIELIGNESDEDKEKVAVWFKKVLKGKLGYVKYVRGKDDQVFLKYVREINEIFDEEIFHIEEKPSFLDKIENSIFILESATDKQLVQGSGFILQGIGLLTNYHVTENGEIFDVKTYKGEKKCSISCGINLVKENESIDYACYAFGKASEEALKLGTSKELTIGSEVIVISYPDYCSGNSPEVQTVNIIGERIFLGQRIYTISGRIVHGASGGAVLNLSHEVVGMIRCGPASLDETADSAIQGFIPIDSIVYDLGN